MTQAEFSNLLRILAAIDMDEMVAVKLIDHADWSAWGTFRRDPFRWFIRADDGKQARLWELIKARHFYSVTAKTSKAERKAT